VSAGDGREVSAIVCPSRYILTAGWSRVVRVYSDLPGHDEDASAGDCAGCIEQWETAHDEDVMCMALLRPTTVVTASYDGDIVVWSMDNGRGSMVARFNADLDTGPLRSRQRSAYKTTSPRRRYMYVLMLSPVYVCLSVCLLDYSKSHELILMNIWRGGHGLRSD